MKIALGIFSAMYVVLALYFIYGAWAVFELETKLQFAMRPITVLYVIGAIYSIAFAFLFCSLAREKKY